MAVLYVGSDQPRAGKTALGITLVGIFRKRGVSAAILKPWTSAAAPGGDADPGAYGALLGQGPQAPAAPVGDGFSDALLEDAARAAAQAARGVDILVVEGLSQAAPEGRREDRGRPRREGGDRRPLRARHDAPWPR